MLYHAERHEAVTQTPWSKDQVTDELNQIFESLIKARLENGLWPTHANEDSDIENNKSLYLGATGTVWGLHEMARFLDRSLPFDLSATSLDIYKQYLEEPDTKKVVPSYFLGETGPLQLCHKFAPSPDITTRLRAAIDENTSNPVNEALWGSPGTMPVALRIGAIDLYKKSADYLFSQMMQTPEGFWIWIQDLYGSKVQYIGAGHGFYGNVYPLLEGFEHLTSEQQTLLIDRTIETSFASVRRANGMANWLPAFHMKPSLLPLTQWCHGAPGVITSLKSFPKNASPEMEQLLLEVGETVWQAGPLKKGIGICHGTDGNGFALLRMFERTGDKMWLTRARQFAMHAITQKNGRHTLWTGEVGLGMFLMACLNETADFPSYDYF